MRIVISKFPACLKNHPDHPLERWVCDISNYLIAQGVVDENTPDIVGIKFDSKSTKYCSLIIEIKDDTWIPAIQLVHVVDFVRAFRQRTNLMIEMHVSPAEGFMYPIEL